MRKSLLLGAVALLPFTMATSCPPENQEPKGVSGTIEVKRRPCGNDGVCQKGETNCWQLQIWDGKTRHFRCVSQTDWNGYRVGQKYS